jgi:hypothetical protein
MVDGSVPDLGIDGRGGVWFDCGWRGSLVRLVGTWVLVDVVCGGLGVGMV